MSQAGSEPEGRLIVQLSSRGQVTLPARARRALGLRTGDALVISMEDGRIVLEPAIVMPAELYTEERIGEFAEAASMTTAEIDRARRRWRVAPRSRR